MVVWTTKYITLNLYVYKGIFYSGNGMIKKSLLVFILCFNAYSMDPCVSIAYKTQVMVLKMQKDNGDIYYDAKVKSPPSTFEELKKEHPNLVQIINIAIDPEQPTECIQDN